jgi:2-hydroxychromene-2-carboxylate isomerase
MMLAAMPAPTLEICLNATIDYYFAPQSPWTYFGHDRFTAIAKAANATVRILPVDYGQIFPISGGLPLPKRAPQRQAYRLVELARFRDALNVPMYIQPKFFPVASDDVARLIIAVDLNDGVDAAMRISGAVFRAVWEQEMDIANPDTLAVLLGQCGLAANRFELSRGKPVQDKFHANTQAAIAANVFGAPSYVVDGEIFWGQDRLEFLQKRLMQAL